MQVSSWDSSPKAQLKATSYVEPVLFSKYVSQSKTYLWRTSIDHSKWGIVQANNKKVACFGDLNRVLRKKELGASVQRGGGMVSLFDSNVNNTDLYNE